MKTLRFKNKLPCKSGKSLLYWFCQNSRPERAGTYMESCGLFRDAETGGMGWKAPRVGHCDAGKAGLVRYADRRFGTCRYRDRRSIPRWDMWACTAGAVQAHFSRPRGLMLCETKHDKTLKSYDRAKAQE